MTQNTQAPRPSGELSLVLGVDGSGKSTLLTGLQERFGATILEPTSTPEAKAFKAANVETLVDGMFIDQRERIFLDLNRRFDKRVIAELDTGKNVATTGNGLVTLVSHGLMRVIIGERGPSEIDDAVKRWIGSDALKPNHAALVYAPDEVIRGRIQERQQAGDHIERFWAFNSPYFLSRYQETLHKVLHMLAETTVVRCVTLDSSRLTPEAMVDMYGGYSVTSQGNGLPRA